MAVQRLLDHFFKDIVVWVYRYAFGHLACNLHRRFLTRRLQYDALFTGACLDHKRDGLEKRVVRLQLL